MHYVNIALGSGGAERNLKAWACQKAVWEIHSVNEFSFFPRSELKLSFFYWFRRGHPLTDQKGGSGSAKLPDTKVVLGDDLPYRILLIINLGRICGGNPECIKIQIIVDVYKRMASQTFI